MEAHMPALRLPDKARLATPFVIESRIPKPEELVVLSKLLLDATITIGKKLEDCTNKWAISGDVAEVISGVNVEPDLITILTSKEGCDEISGRLAKYSIAPATVVERRLEREASIQLKSYPVMIRSYLASFNIEGSKLEVYGDLQIKVGEWDWGDPVDFDPDYVYVVGVKVPVVPLQLKSEIYNGLGWRDRATKIHEAVVRSRHKFG
jgi:aminoglycoside-2''-adenylyltransferase